MKKGLVLFGMLVLFSLFPVAALAADGGNADVQGKITFFEEGSDEQPKESGELPKKPVGKFPSTGELVKKPIVWFGFGLIVVVIILLFLKRRRSNDEKEN